MKVVDVSQNKIGSDGASALCAILARDIPLVEELYLDSNNISDGLQHIMTSSTAAAGRGLQHLKVLTACNNQIRNLGTLPHLPALSTLYLDRNPLGVGLTHSTLEKCTTLTTLSLSETCLNNLSRTCAILSSLSNLRNLSLQPTLLPPHARARGSRVRVAAATAAVAEVGADSPREFNPTRGEEFCVESGVRGARGG